MLVKYEEEYQLSKDNIKKLFSQTYQIHKDVLTSFLAKETKSQKILSKQIVEFEHLANKIDNETIKIIAKYQPEGVILRTLATNLKITNELVRIVLGAKTFSKNAQNILQKNFDFAPFNKEIKKLYETSLEALELVSANYGVEENESFLSDVKAKETITDEYYQFLQEKMLDSKLDSKDTFFVLRMMRKLERTADHCVNIAVLIEYANSGGVLETF